MSEKTLESLLDSKEIHQPILKEISPEYSLEGLMLKLKLQYFGHLMWRTDSLEMTLMLGKTEGRRRGWQRMRWLDGITNWKDTSLSKLCELVDRQGSLVCCGPWVCKESDKTEWLNWTELNLWNIWEIIMFLAFCDEIFTLMKWTWVWILVCFMCFISKYLIWHRNSLLYMNEFIIIVI